MYFTLYVQPTGVDTFECVDINKQPAFDHPLLKNHKIQVLTKFLTFDFLTGEND